MTTRWIRCSSYSQIVKIKVFLFIWKYVTIEMWFFLTLSTIEQQSWSGDDEQ